MSEPTASPPRLSELVELTDLAVALNLPKSWLRKQAVAGTIPVLKIGQKMRFNITAVEAAVEMMAAGSNGVAPAPSPAPVAASTSPTPPVAAAPIAPPPVQPTTAAAPPAEKKPRARKPKETATAPAAAEPVAAAPADEIPIPDEPEPAADDKPKSRKRQSFEEPAPEGLF